MSKKHLSFTERVLIERYLAMDDSLSHIAHKLHRSTSTIISTVGVSYLVLHDAPTTVFTS